MMTQGRSNPWVRRLTFVGGNLAAAVLVVCTVVLPVWSFFSDREDDIASKQAFLARLNAVAGQQASVQKLVQQSEAQGDRGEFLTGVPSIITADIQTKLKGMAAAAGAQTRSVQGLPLKVEGQLRYIGARIDIQGPLQSVQRTLHAIESAKPYLFITEAIIKPALPMGRPDAPGEPVIQAQLDVFGASRSEGRGP